MMTEISGAVPNQSNACEAPKNFWIDAKSPKTGCMIRFFHTSEETVGMMKKGEIISTRKTLGHLQSHKAGIEDGSFHGPPAIKPLILPTRTFEGEMDFTLGARQMKFIEANIHSDDAALVWIPDEGLLLAGDTMEDTVTYVVSPQDFEIHLRDLDRLWALNPQFIFPNHGDPDIISVGGFGKGLIKAQQQYIRMLMRAKHEETVRNMPLREMIAGPLQMGWVNYFAPYEEIHAMNLKKVMAS